MVAVIDSATGYFTRSLSKRSNFSVICSGLTKDGYSAFHFVLRFFNLLNLFSMPCQYDKEM